MDRLEKLYAQKEFDGMYGFPEALLAYEKDEELNFGSTFQFSRKDYDVYGQTFWLGKVNDVYYLGLKMKEGNHFSFFQNKKMIQLYFNKEFNNFNQTIADSGIDLNAEKIFWLKEVESFS